MEKEEIIYFQHRAIDFENPFFTFIPNADETLFHKFNNTNNPNIPHFCYKKICSLQENNPTFSDNKLREISSKLKNTDIINTTRNIEYYPDISELNMNELNEIKIYNEAYKIEIEQVKKYYNFFQKNYVDIYNNKYKLEHLSIDRKEQECKTRSSINNYKLTSCCNLINYFSLDTNNYYEIFSEYKNKQNKFIINVNEFCNEMHYKFRSSKLKSSKLKSSKLKLLKLKLLKLKEIITLCFFINIVDTLFCDYLNLLNYCITALNDFPYRIRDKNCTLLDLTKLNTFFIYEENDKNQTLKINHMNKLHNPIIAKTMPNEVDDTIEIGTYIKFQTIKNSNKNSKNIIFSNK